MIQSQSFTQTSTDAHSALFAEALIRSAKKHPLIAPTLQAAVLNQNWPSASIPSHSKQTIPSALSEAAYVRTMEWLLHTITPTTHPYTTNLLATWAQNYEAPKDAVIGIVGIAIMGPTLGILDKPKKKKKAELPVIIEATAYERLEKIELAQLTSELAQQVHATELRLADGNAYQMHPDTAEWSFEAGAVALYTVNPETLALISATLPDILYRSHHTSPALACSPAIAEEINEHFSLSQISL